jgi:site-specific recombinase XerD
VPKALRFIKEKLQFKYSSQSHYRIGWSLMKEFMNSNEIAFVSPAVCHRFIEHLCDLQKKRELLPKEKRSISAALVLCEFIETGYIQKKKKFRYLEGQVGKLIQQYILFKQPERLDSMTIGQIERNLSRFNFWLAGAHIHDISNVKLHDVVRFIQGLDSSKKGCINLLLMHLKGFFRYLYNNDLIPTNIAAAIPRDNYKKQARLPSYYSEEEIGQVLKHIDRGTVLGKRDYAIFMLAVRLGMRASDIANIKFGNLRWDVSTIVFQQCKGGKETKLPLLPAVGNAILDYLQYGRPKSDESAVFLLFRSPYLPIKPDTVGGIVMRRLRNAHLNLKSRKKGSHVLRHSLVKQLLDNGRALPVITEVLGHKSQESTRHYIRIDMESLRKCALDVTPVDPQFYNQGNRNYFYL